MPPDVLEGGFHIIRFDRLVGPWQLSIMKPSFPISGQCT